MQSNGEVKARDRGVGQGGGRGQILLSLLSQHSLGQINSCVSFPSFYLSF